MIGRKPKNYQVAEFEKTSKGKLKFRGWSDWIMAESKEDAIREFHLWGMAGEHNYYYGIISHEFSEKHQKGLGDNGSKKLESMMDDENLIWGPDISHREKHYDLC